ARTGAVIATGPAPPEAAEALDLPRWPSLTGEAPRTRRCGEALLVGIPRNDGFEVQRFDPATRRPYGVPVVVGRDPFDLAAAAVVGDALCVAAGGALRAYDLGTGRPRWRLPLEPNGPWRVEP